MRATRPTLAGALIAVLLIVPAATVLGQVEEHTSSTYVTGTAVEQIAFDGAESVSHEGSVMHEQGHRLEQRVDWSDPRLPAEHWIRLDLMIYDEDAPDGVMTVQTSHLLTDSEGTWRGTGRAFETETDRYSYYELVGEGAYDGLHALLRGTPGQDMHGPWDVEYDGWIFEGALTEFPEPAEPATGEGTVMRTAPDREAATGAEAVAPPDAMAPAAFYYTVETVGEPNWGTDTESADGTVIETRGYESVERMKASDPRATGELVTSQRSTQIEVDGTVVQTQSVTMRLTNDGGSWSGPGEVMLAGSDQVMEMAGMMKLTGEGDYEGLTLFLSDSGDFLSQTAWGMIVPSELVASMPDPVEPAVE
ncbi:MAG: hypothetical protein AB1Z66_01870 [Candidatus Limnocylindrales bacterium]